MSQISTGGTSWDGLSVMAYPQDIEQLYQRKLAVHFIQYRFVVRKWLPEQELQMGASYEISTTQYE